MDKKIVSTKEYIITEFQYDDQTATLQRVNDGFSALELLGVLELTELEIVQQIRGQLKPEIIETKRKVITNK